MIRIKKFNCVLMRGGTSKAVFFKKEDIPANENVWEDFLLDVMGSPDPRQIDGLGGANSLTSKVAIIAKSVRQGIDVDYTFAQVSLVERKVDMKGNCGNISSAVGPFAIMENMVKIQGERTKVRVYNTNTNKVMIVDVDTKNGQYNPDGDCHIAGVPGTASAIRLQFLKPQGSITGKTLPTDTPINVLSTSVGDVEVSIVDAGNPLVFVRATDLHLNGNELPNAYSSIQLELFEEIREAAGRLCGFVDESNKVSPAIPKMAIISHPQAYVDLYGNQWTENEMDLTVRMMSMQKPHQALAVTGAVCITVASQVLGSLVSEITKKKPSIRIAHPSGVAEAEVLQANELLDGVSVIRTARSILKGYVLTKKDY